MHRGQLLVVAQQLPAARQQAEKRQLGLDLEPPESLQVPPDFGPRRVALEGGRQLELQPPEPRYGAQLLRQRRLGDPPAQLRQPLAPVLRFPEAAGVGQHRPGALGAEPHERLQALERRLRLRRRPAEMARQARQVRPRKLRRSDQRRLSRRHQLVAAQQPSQQVEIQGIGGFPIEQVSVLLDQIGPAVGQHRVLVGAVDVNVAREPIAKLVELLQPLLPTALGRPAPFGTRLDLLEPRRDLASRPAVRMLAGEREGAGNHRRGHHEGDAGNASGPVVPHLRLCFGRLSRS